MASNSGFYTGGRPVQATVKVHGLSPPDVYGLHSSPVPISYGGGAH